MDPSDHQIHGSGGVFLLALDDAGHRSLAEIDVSTAVGLGILLLVIAPEPWEWGGRLGTLAIGMFQLLIGWLLRRNYRRIVRIRESSTK
jgi:hypothetical protein